jgi:SNF family Na+-dependent transporter
MGVMTSLGSYNKKSKPVIFDSIFVPIVNSSVSFLAGFAVFATVGYLNSIGDPIAQNKGSYGLAFAAYPTALDHLDFKHFWCFILFLTLYTLGVDSCFPILEAIATVI